MPVSLRMQQIAHNRNVEAIATVVHHFQDGHSLLDLALEATTGHRNAQVTHNLKTIEVGVV